MENANATDQLLIILAGGTGHLGSAIAGYLRKKGVRVRALLRNSSQPSQRAELEGAGVETLTVDYADAVSLAAACKGGSCVVSALSGVEDVILDVQTRLMEAAIAAGVPRFIPSDYCIDYNRLPGGSNRNLDLRRAFRDRLDRAPIRGTSILNGMFTGLLTGQAPLILTGIHRVLYWGSPDVPLDFTTVDNTAQYTAAAAVDASAPRWLRIAGSVMTIRDLRRAAEEVTGEKFMLLRAGGLGAFKTMIHVTRTLFPKKREVFPPWQGMQYLHNMFTGLPKLDPLDNDRYGGIRWTSVEEVLAAGLKKK